MSDFPKGPWEAHELSCEDHRGQGWIRAGDQDVAAYGDSSLWMEENRAIGKLIAAAPELLEALKELLDSYYAMMPPYEAGKSSQDAWADRRAAARNNATALIERLS